MKRHAPAAERNREPIAAVLTEELPATGLVLEVKLWNIGDVTLMVYPIAFSGYRVEFLGQHGRLRELYPQAGVGGGQEPKESDLTRLHPGNYVGGRLLYRSFYQRAKGSSPPAC